MVQCTTTPAEINLAKDMRVGPSSLRDLLRTVRRCGLQSCWPFRLVSSQKKEGTSELTLPGQVGRHVAADPVSAAASTSVSPASTGQREPLAPRPAGATCTCWRSVTGWCARHGAAQHHTDGPMTQRPARAQPPMPAEPCGRCTCLSVSLQQPLGARGWDAPPAGRPSPPTLSARP